MWILALAATVAFAVVAVGIVWSASGSPPPVTTPTSVGSQNANFGDLPPGVATITATRHGTRITFQWTYDGAEATDTFLWRYSGSAATATVHKPEVVLRDKSGTQLCIQVQVVRADGGGNVDWSPEGCGS